jgi:hypothetical protein
MKGISQNLDNFNKSQKTEEKIIGWQDHEELQI